MTAIDPRQGDDQGDDQHRISPTSLARFSHFVDAVLIVKKAAARANHHAAVLSDETLKAILRACDKLGANPSAFSVDPFSGGGGILINTQTNHLIARESNVERSEINASQSTADVVATALRIALVRVGKKLQTELQDSIRLMDFNREKFADTSSMARTCLQDAMPVALGTLFEGYAEVLKRRHAALERAIETLHQVNLGGTVIGSSEGASVIYRMQVIKELKAEAALDLKLRTSLYDAAQNADDIGELMHALALLAEVSIKIGKDLRLLHSGPKHGLNEIQLPQIISGSSFFKNKNNPTIPETFLQGCFLTLGRCRSAGLTLEHAELNLNVFEAAGGFCIYEALELLTHSFHLLNAHCLQSISAAKEN